MREGFCSPGIPGPQSAAERRIEAAEGGGLHPVGEQPHQQPARQMGRSSPAQMVAPLQTELIETHPARGAEVLGMCVQLEAEAAQLQTEPARA